MFFDGEKNWKCQNKILATITFSVVSVRKVFHFMAVRIYFGQLWLTLQFHRKIRKLVSHDTTAFSDDPPEISFSPTPDILRLWSSCFPIGVTENHCPDGQPVSNWLTLLFWSILSVHCSNVAMCYIIVIITNTACCCFYFIINFSVYSALQWSVHWMSRITPATATAVSSHINMISRFIFSSQIEQNELGTGFRFLTLLSLATQLTQCLNKFCFHSKYAVYQSLITEPHVFL